MLIIPKCKEGFMGVKELYVCPVSQSASFSCLLLNFSSWGKRYLLMQEGDQKRGPRVCCMTCCCVAFNVPVPLPSSHSQCRWTSWLFLGLKTLQDSWFGEETGSGQPLWCGAGAYSVILNLLKRLECGLIAIRPVWIWLEFSPEFEKHSQQNFSSSLTHIPKCLSPPWILT